jgi:N-acetylmuramoyl-L-alanine amidase
MTSRLPFWAAVWISTWWLGATAVASPARASFGGVEYVSLQDWATRHGFEFHWKRQRTGIELVRGKSVLSFEKDSNFASIDGVNVFLGWAVAARNGVALIAADDIRTALDPLVTPERPPTRPKTIYLDPGHGGKDPGTKGEKDVEKRQTLALAKEVGRVLKARGYRVLLTRARDAFVEKPDRAFEANRARADLFVSIHFNSADDRSVNGVETYCLTPPGGISTNSHGEGGPAVATTGNRQDHFNLLLAYYVQRALVRGLGSEDRGVHRARFAVLKPLLMPGILVEGGFLSNALEERRIEDPKGRKRLAKALADGIDDYSRQAGPAGPEQP